MDGGPGPGGDGTASGPARFPRRRKEGAMTDAVLEMRLVVTAEDYEAALAFYRDVLGLRSSGRSTSPAAG